MLSDSAEPTLTPPGKTLVCESCAAEFTCNAGQETCWCFDVEVSPEKLDELRENYARCLCQDCLAGNSVGAGLAPARK